MDKLKSYLGLGVVAFLAYIFLWTNVSEGWNEEPMRGTDFDRKPISALIRKNNSEYALAGRVLAYFSRCPDGPITALKPYPVAQKGCSLSELAPDPYEISILRRHFERHDPGISKLVDEYFDLNDGPEKDAMRRELERRGIRAYPALMKDWESSYAKTVYYIHALFIAACVALVFFRRSVGGMLVWPVITGIRILVKAARGFHEKM